MIIASILARKGSDIVSVSPDDTVLEVARTLNRHRIGAALVRGPDGAMLGIISERDIVRGMAEQGIGTSQRPAAQLMTAELHTIEPRTLVAEALSVMTHRRIRHLPVLEDGRLVGLISIGDLVKARIEEAEYEAQELKAYVLTAG